MLCCAMLYLYFGCVHVGLVIFTVGWVQHGTARTVWEAAEVNRCALGGRAAIVLIEALRLPEPAAVVDAVAVSERIRLLPLQN